MPLQWRNQIINASLEEDAGKRCSECNQYRNLSEGADSVGGQLRGNKECPFSGVTNYGSLEEGAGKRCSEYLCSVSTKTFQKALTAPVDKCAEIKSAPSVA